MKAVALLAVLLLLGACSKPSSSGGGVASRQGASDVTPEMTQMFKMRCSPCHGEGGHGDGPGAAALNPKPRNYTDVAWQKSVTDDQIRKTILYGGAAVGKSPMMPPNPDLDGKPELDGLVAIVRGFGGK